MALKEMNQVQARPRGNEYRTTWVCVDSYDDGVLVGRFYNPNYEEGVSFRSLSQFLVKMEDMLNDMNFPQSFTVARSFSTPVPELSDDSNLEVRSHVGELATFVVRILFRQNASWQGSVTWLEKNKEESFRSVLEMILLMNSAMED